MVIKRIGDAECRGVLERAYIGRLGCAQADQPYVVPIYFAYEDDFIYMFSTFGKKIKWMRENPKVCVQVDEVSGQAQWQSVIANGTYQELPEPEFTSERAHARKLLEKRHRWWLNALAERRMDSADDFIDPLFCRIRVESMSGLAASDD